MAPSSSVEMYEQLNTAYSLDGPVCIRFPRGKSLVEEFKNDTQQKVGKANVVREGLDVAILAFGETLNATIVDMRFVKPMDKDLIRKLSKSHKKLITIEDNVVSGGAGSSVAEFIHNEKLDVSLDIIGLPDEFGEHGSQEELYEMYGLTVENIVRCANSQ